MNVKRIPPQTMRHPLTDVCMALFEARPQHQHDIGTMALALSGGLISGRRSSSANKAYRLVAEDVLGCAVEGGLLYVDGAGWYRRTRKGDDL